MSEFIDPDEKTRKRLVLAMEKVLPDSNLDFNNLIKIKNKVYELDTSSCPYISLEEDLDLLAAFIVASTRI